MGEGELINMTLFVQLKLTAHRKKIKKRTFPPRSGGIVQTAAFSQSILTQHLSFGITLACRDATCQVSG